MTEINLENTHFFKRVLDLDYRIDQYGEVYDDSKIEQHNDRHGYVYVKLYDGNTMKRYYIHDLVANAYIDNPNNYKYVCHKDGNRKNNKYNNLEYCEHQKKINIKSRHKGIYWSNKSQKWHCVIYVNKKTIYIGMYDNIDQALEAQKRELNFYDV